MSPIPEIVRHELLTAARSKRLWAVCLAFTGGAVVMGIIYGLTVNNMREALINELVKKGASPLAASQALSMGSSETYRSMLKAFSGVLGADLNPAFVDSIVLPALLFGAQLLLPWLINLACFDHVAAELQTRSLAFNILRVSRTEWLAGKTLAWTAVTSLLTVVAVFAAFEAAQRALGNTSTGHEYYLVLQVAAGLLPFQFAFVCLTTLSSTLFNRPFAALAGAVTLRFVLWMPRVLGTKYDLPWLKSLSPSSWDTWLWEAGWKGPLMNMTALLLLGALAYVAADLRLRSRDL